MFSCSKLAVIQDLISMTQFGHAQMWVIGIEAISSAVLYPAVLCTEWIILGKTLIPEASRKTDFDVMTMYTNDNIGLSPLAQIVQCSMSDFQIM